MRTCTEYTLHELEPSSHVLAERLETHYCFARFVRRHIESENRLPIANHLSSDNACHTELDISDLDTTLLYNYEEPVVLLFPEAAHVYTTISTAIMLLHAFIFCSYIGALPRVLDDTYRKAFVRAHLMFSLFINMKALELTDLLAY